MKIMDLSGTLFQIMIMACKVDFMFFYLILCHLESFLSISNTPPCM